jgi:hypothetical protein
MLLHAPMYAYWLYARCEDRFRLRFLWLLMKTLETGSTKHVKHL